MRRKNIDLMYFGSVITKEGRAILRDPKQRRFLFDREARTGLLEDSILNADLYFPNQERTSLSYETAPAGRWVGFDFNRPNEFGPSVMEKGRQKFDGRLSIFNIEEVKNNSANQFTPTRTFNMFDVDHLLHIEMVPLEEAIREGFIEDTTYEDAYRRVNLYDRYRKFLVLGDLADKSIYRVTPKGNGLVFLWRDFGEKSEKPQAVPELKPAWAT